MSDFIDGIDVSKWNLKMNWSIASSAGAKFAFIRAGSIDNYTGICYTDHQFERNAETAPDFMPIGFYWYFRPQHNAVKQADYFCNLIRDKRDKLPCVLDEEETGDLPPALITASGANFVLRVNENLGVLPILYSRGAWLNANTIPDELMKLLDLWVARYTFKKKPWGNLLPYPDWPGIKPRDYLDWRFWQWSAKGNKRGKEFGATATGAAISMDLNRFNGDQAAFDDYYKTEPSPSLPDDIGIKIDIDGVKYHGRVPRV